MNKIYRSVALAVLAAFTVGVAANADGCYEPEKRSHVSYRKISKRATKAAAKTELIKETKITTTKTIEKPVIINAPAPAAPAAAVVEEKQQTISQPAVIDAATPVVIDRYEKRHRSLIHLGLFPFNLFGQ